ncbi:hypothetical protein D3C72_1408620 [compost metagenome]
MLAHAGRTIGKHRPQGAGLHLLEAQGQGALHRPAFHGLASQVQGSGTRGAVVVDVHYRYAAHAHFVECRLAAGGIAIDISDISLLNQVIVQSCVFQCLASGFSAHFDIRPTGPRLQERDHTNPGNVRFVRHHILHKKFSPLRLLALLDIPSNPGCHRYEIICRLYPRPAGGIGVAPPVFARLRLPRRVI